MLLEKLTLEEARRWLKSAEDLASGRHMMTPQQRDWLDRELDHWRREVAILEMESQ